MDDFTDYHADTMREPPTAVFWVGIAACIAFWAVLVGVML